MHTLISAATVCRSVCVHLQLFACLFTHRRWPSFIVRPTTGADRQTRGDVEEGNGMRSLSADKCISDKRAAERLVILRIEWLQHPARMGVGKQNCAASWGGEGRGGGKIVLEVSAIRTTARRLWTFQRSPAGEARCSWHHDAAQHPRTSLPLRAAVGRQSVGGFGGGVCGENFNCAKSRMRQFFPREKKAPRRTSGRKFGLKKAHRWKFPCSRLGQPRGLRAG